MMLLDCRCHLCTKLEDPESWDLATAKYCLLKCVLNVTDRHTLFNCAVSCLTVCVIKRRDCVDSTVL